MNNFFWRFANWAWGLNKHVLGFAFPDYTGALTSPSSLVAHPLSIIGSSQGKRMISALFRPKQSPELKFPKNLNVPPSTNLYQFLASTSTQNFPKKTGRFKIIKLHTYVANRVCCASLRQTVIPVKPMVTTDLKCSQNFKVKTRRMKMALCSCIFRMCKK